MPVRVSEDRFEELVSDALDALPEKLVEAVSNVVVLVEDAHPDDPHLLGLYEGVALTERDSWYTGLPDAITIYRRPLMAMCGSEDELVEEVRVTVIHEFAHHFGIDDEQLHEWGWG